MKDKSNHIEQSIIALRSEMTLDEKILMLSGQDFWTLPAIERLGIPSLRLADGPTGLRSNNSDPSTVFPIGTALAATWDRDLVEAVSGAIGSEAIAHGVDVLLAPGVNIQRTPLGGRNFEYYSEDPHLSAEIGVAYVNGVQSRGVGTSVKHYAANNQERNRMSISANIHERPLLEIYLSSFEPIIRRAKPWTVMSAYNRVNGTFASEHHHLLEDVLKTEWGFDGVVVSDWGATKSTVGSANHGLDLEMPGPGRFFGEALKNAVAHGHVPIEKIDEHVLRVLRLIARCGLLDGNPKKVHGSLRTDEHRELARKAAAEAMVLLRNEGNLLPIREAKSIAVIGALADYPAIQGGGSSQVIPDRIVSPLEGLRNALPEKVDIRFERGVDPEPKPPILDGRLLSPFPGSNEQGLQAKYYSSSAFGGDVVHEEVDWRFAKLGFGNVAQQPEDPGFSVEWTGWFTPRYSGHHEWLITHSNSDVELFFDDEILVGPDTDRETELLYMILEMNVRPASVTLEAGRSYPIKIRYSQPAGNAIKGFNILNVFLREPKPNIEDALDVARSCKQAIVFVGTGTTAETEGEDRRSMELSGQQNALVERVLEVNPNTVVVLNTGAPVEMPWADTAPSILQMWLPGQEGGHALADVLTGNVNPSGKLPMTFPKRYEDNPTFLHYPGGQHTDYGEGLLVGYRYYDKVGIEPLFPFGHGLSYSKFELSDLSAPRRISVGEPFRCSLRIANTGPVAGSETVQVYVEDRATQEAQPLRQLRTFKKITLDVGDEETVEIELDERAFAYWNSDTQTWTVSEGEYVIHVGTSSRDLQLPAELTIVQRKN